MGEYQLWFPWSILYFLRQTMIWHVLNPAFKDNWSVASAAFNTRLISSLSSNHHWYFFNLMLSLLANMQLFKETKTVFTSTSVIGTLIKAVYDSCGSVVIRLQSKLKPVYYRGDVPAVCSIMTNRTRLYFTVQELCTLGGNKISSLFYYGSQISVMNLIIIQCMACTFDLCLFYVLL